MKLCNLNKMTIEMYRKIHQAQTIVFDEILVTDPHDFSPAFHGSYRNKNAAQKGKKNVE